VCVFRVCSGIVKAGEDTCGRDNRGQSDFSAAGCRIKDKIIADRDRLELAKAALQVLLSVAQLSSIYDTSY
jgi:hypothetical protein